jgi:Glycosyl hydrolase family 63 N-terminal domain
LNKEFFQATCLIDLFANMNCVVGVNFGIQSLVDRGLNITTSFIKQQGGNHGGDWTNRITVQPLNSKVGFF